MKLLITLVLLILPSQIYAEAPKVKIPVLIPLTGNASEQAIWIKQGLELATHQINQSSDFQIELLYQDTQLDPKTAISAYRHLKSFDSFPAIITMGSGVAMALSPIVNQDQVIQMGVATETVDYTSPDDYNFRTSPTAEQVAGFAENFITNQLKANKIAIIKINNDYGISSANELKKKFLRDGNLIVAEEVVQPGDSNFRSQLLKVKTSAPDLIYLISYPNEGALILKQAKQLGLNTKILATTAINGNENFLELAAGGAEGISVISMTPVIPNSPNPLTVKFIKDFEGFFKFPPSLQAFLALKSYDALMILANQIKTCGPKDTACIKEKLFQVKSYQGSSGKIAFDHNGDVTSDLYILTVKDGAFILS